MDIVNLAKLSEGPGFVLQPCATSELEFVVQSLRKDGFKTVEFDGSEITSHDSLRNQINEAIPLPQYQHFKEWTWDGFADLLVDGLLDLGAASIAVVWRRRHRDSAGPPSILMDDGNVCKHCSGFERREIRARTTRRFEGCAGVQHDLIVHFENRVHSYAIGSKGAAGK